MEEQYWSQWDGHTEGEGEGALALFNLTDGPAGKEPTTLSRSSEPMRVDFRNFIRPKKVVTSKINTKKEKVKLQKQNRFEILGCLLEDNEVNDEEPKDLSVLRSTSSGTTPSATSRIPIVSRLVKTKKWNTDVLCRNFNHGIAGKTEQAELWFLESSRDLEAKKTELDKTKVEELCGLFEVDNSLCHLNDQWMKIEAVMDSGAVESVALADVAPWVPISESVCSKRGQTYMSAGGEKLTNLGEKQMRVWTNEGSPAMATFQCADVTRPLCSVSKICDQGIESSLKAKEADVLERRDREGQSARRRRWRSRTRSPTRSGRTHSKWCKSRRLGDAWEYLSPRTTSCVQRARGRLRMWKGQEHLRPRDRSRSAWRRTRQSSTSVRFSVDLACARWQKIWLTR